MAERFNLTAQLQLQAPKNTAQVVSQIKKQLRGIGAVDVQIKNARSISQANKALQQTNTSIKNANKSASRLNATLRESARRFSVITLATGTLLAIANEFRNSVKRAVEFEVELLKISQVTGKTTGQLSELSAEVTNLSTSLGVGSQSLLNTSRILAQAGFSSEAAKASLEILAQTTLAATFNNIQDTTEGAIALLNQFGAAAKRTGSEAEFLEQSLDAINAVSKKFAVESSDLISVVRRVGGVFSAAGGSVEELIALFTSVRATTREGAETIATGLRTIFTRIQRQDTVDQLEALGISLRDAQGNFVGAFEAVKRLSEGLSGLDPRSSEFAAIAEELGGFRQIGKVIPLIQQFTTAQEALKVAQEGTGSIAADAEIAQKSLANQFAKTRESFDALIRKFADSETFRSVATGVLQLANAFIKVLDSLEPLLPLLTTLFALKAGQGLAQGIGLLRGFGGGSGIKASRFATGGKVHHFARGGSVPGTGNRDTVPAMLTPGEFVIRKSSVKKLGADNLAAMNENRYATGGEVGQYSDARPYIKKSNTTFRKAGGDVFDLSKNRFNEKDRIEFNRSKDTEINLDSIKTKGFKNTALYQEYKNAPNAQVRGKAFEKIAIKQKNLTAAENPSSRLDAISASGDKAFEIKSELSKSALSNSALGKKIIGGALKPVSNNVDKVFLQSKLQNKELSSAPNTINFGNVEVIRDVTPKTTPKETAKETPKTTPKKTNFFGGRIQKFVAGGIIQQAKADAAMNEGRAKYAGGTTGTGAKPSDVKKSTKSKTPKGQIEIVSKIGQIVANKSDATDVQQSKPRLTSVQKLREKTKNNPNLLNKIKPLNPEDTVTIQPKTVEVATLNADFDEKKVIKPGLDSLDNSIKAALPNSARNNKYEKISQDTKATESIGGFAFERFVGGILGLTPGGQTTPFDFSPSKDPAGQKKLSGIAKKNPLPPFLDAKRSKVSPSEIVDKAIRQKEVKTSFASQQKFFGGLIQKFVAGGIVQQAKAGAAILDPAGTKSNSVKVTVEDMKKQFTEFKDLARGKDPVSKFYKGTSFNITESGLNQKTSNTFKSALEDGLVTGINTSASILAKDLGTPAAKIDPSQTTNFVKSINTSIFGRLYENVIGSISRQGDFSKPDTDPNRPFDAELGLPPKLKDNFEGLPPKFIDLKSSSAAAKERGGIRGKIIRQIKRELIQDGILQSDFPGKKDSLKKSESEALAKEKKKAADLKAGLGFPARRAAGSPSGGEKSSQDTVPALLTPGEFVFNKKAAQSIGYGNLNRMNKQGVQGFNKGGFVGFRKYATGTGPTGAQANPNVAAGIPNLSKIAAEVDKLAAYFKKLGLSTQSQAKATEFATKQLINGNSVERVRIKVLESVIKTEKNNKKSTIDETKARKKLTKEIQTEEKARKNNKSKKDEQTPSGGGLGTKAAKFGEKLNNLGSSVQTASFNFLLIAGAISTVVNSMSGLSKATKNATNQIIAEASTFAFVGSTVLQMAGSFLASKRITDALNLVNAKKVASDATNSGVTDGNTVSKVQNTAATKAETASKAASTAVTGALAGAVIAAVGVFLLFRFWSKEAAEEAKGFAEQAKKAGEELAKTGTDAAASKQRTAIFQKIDKANESAALSLGSAVGAVTGAAAGFAAGVGGAAAAGAVFGSVIPGVGTAIGLLAGAVVGAVVAFAVSKSQQEELQKKQEANISALDDQIKSYQELLKAQFAFKQKLKEIEELDLTQEQKIEQRTQALQEGPNTSRAALEAIAALKILSASAGKTADELRTISPEQIEELGTAGYFESAKLDQVQVAQLDLARKQLEAAVNGLANEISIASGNLKDAASIELTGLKSFDEVFADRTSLFRQNFDIWSGKILENAKVQEAQNRIALVSAQVKLEEIRASGASGEQLKIFKNQVNTLKEAQGKATKQAQEQVEARKKAFKQSNELRQVEREKIAQEIAVRQRLFDLLNKQVEQLESYTGAIRQQENILKQIDIDDAISSGKAPKIEVTVPNVKLPLPQLKKEIGVLVRSAPKAERKTIQEAGESVTASKVQSKKGLENLIGLKLTPEQADSFEKEDARKLFNPSDLLKIFGDQAAVDAFLENLSNGVQKAFAEGKPNPEDLVGLFSPLEDASENQAELLSLASKRENNRRIIAARLLQAENKRREEAIEGVKKFNDVSLQAAETLAEASGQSTAEAALAEEKRGAQRTLDAGRSGRGGIRLEAGNIKQLAIAKRRAKNEEKRLQQDLKNAQAAGATADQLEGLQKSLNQQKNIIKDVNSELERFAESTAKVSVLQEKLEKAQASREQQFAILEEFVVGGQEDRKALSDAFLGLKAAVATGTVQNQTPEARKATFGLLDKLSDVQIGATGLTGKEVKQELIFRDAVANGFPPELARELATSTSIEQDILAELKKQTNLQRNAQGIAAAKATGGIIRRSEGGPIYKADGGTIFKPRGTDTVPAMLTPGEFVIRKSAVDKIGSGNLSALNDGKAAVVKSNGGPIYRVKGGGVEEDEYKPLYGPKRKLFQKTDELYDKYLKSDVADNTTGFLLENIVSPIVGTEVKGVQDVWELAGYAARGIKAQRGSRSAEGRIYDYENRPKRPNFDPKISLTQEKFDNLANQNETGRQKLGEEQLAKRREDRKNEIRKKLQDQVNQSRENPFQRGNILARPGVGETFLDVSKGVNEERTKKEVAKSTVGRRKDALGGLLTIQEAQPQPRLDALGNPIPVVQKAEDKALKPIGKQVNINRREIVKNYKGELVTVEERNRERLKIKQDLESSKAISDKQTKYFEDLEAKRKSFDEILKGNENPIVTNNELIPTIAEEAEQTLFEKFREKKRTRKKEPSAFDEFQRRKETEAFSQFKKRYGLESFSQLLEQYQGDQDNKGATSVGEGLSAFDEFQRRKEKEKKDRGPSAFQEFQRRKEEQDFLQLGLNQKDRFFNSSEIPSIGERAAEQSKQRLQKRATGQPKALPREITNSRGQRVNARDKQQAARKRKEAKRISKNLEDNSSPRLPKLKGISFPDSNITKTILANSFGNQKDFIDLVRDNNLNNINDNKRNLRQFITGARKNKIIPSQAIDDIYNTSSFDEEIAGLLENIKKYFDVFTPDKVEAKDEFKGKRSVERIDLDTFNLDDVLGDIKGAPKLINTLWKRSQGITYDQGLDLIKDSVKNYKNTFNKANGGLIYRAKGGPSGQDRVPAMLTPGEFVMSPEAVNRHGIGFMNQLNRGKVPGFRKGGVVGEPQYKFLGGVLDSAKQATSMLLDTSQLEGVFSTFSSQFGESLTNVVNSFSTFSQSLTDLTNAFSQGMTINHNFTGDMTLAFKIENGDALKNAVGEAITPKIQELVSGEINRRIDELKNGTSG